MKSSFIHYNITIKIHYEGIVYIVGQRENIQYIKGFFLWEKVTIYGAESMQPPQVIIDFFPVASTGNLNANVLLKRQLYCAKKS